MALDNVSVIEVVLQGAKGASGASLLTRIGRFTSQADQSPTGLGDAGIITVSAGAGGDTANGELTVDPDGTITANVAGNYSITLVAQFGRSNSIGESVMLGRVVKSTDGGTTYNQQDSTFLVKIGGNNVLWRETFTTLFELNVGDKIKYEMARDPSGADDGSIMQQQPTGDLNTWNPTDTVLLDIYV